MKPDQLSKGHRFLSGILFVCLMSACGPQVVVATREPVAAGTVTPGTTAVPATPTATLLPPSTTPTLDPNLPCGGVMRERIYLFLNCDDIRRIRHAYLAGARNFSQSGADDFFEKWLVLKQVVDHYLSRFPTKYNPDASWDVLWWGPGNYVMRDMAILYLVTGDGRYAQDLKRLLELVYTNTPQLRQLTNFDARTPRGDEYSGGILSHPQYGEVALQSVLFGYLAIRDSYVLDDLQRTTYDQFFMNQARLLEAAAILRGNDTPLASTRNRNVPIGANAAALTYALAFPDDPVMQDLYRRVRPRVEWQIGHYFESDGGWGENTEWYGYRVTEGVILLAETLLKNRGADIYPQSFEGNTIQKMCAYFLALSAPNGMMPGLNDSGHYFIDPDLFRLCAVRTGDPRLLFAAEHFWLGRKSAYGRNSTDWITPFHSVVWVALSQDSPLSPDYTSILMPASGVAILRDGWEKNGQYALLQFTGSRVHQDLVFGNLFLFANGPWIVGNGYMGQSGNATDQQSTVSMDNRNQTETGGEPAAFADLLSIGVASVIGRPYSSLEHARTLLWIKPWSQWVVVDDLIPLARSAHSYQLRWYVRGWTKTHENGSWSFARVGDGRLWIQIFPQETAEYSAIQRTAEWEEFVNDAQGVEVEVKSAEPVRLVSALTSIDDQAAPDLEREEMDGTTIVRSVRGLEEWLWFIPGEDRSVVNGVVGCLSKTVQQISSFCLINGTSLEQQAIRLIASDVPASVEANWTEQILMTDATEAASISVYWPQPVSRVLEADNSLSFSREGDFLRITVPPGKHILAVYP